MVSHLSSLMRIYESFNLFSKFSFCIERAWVILLSALRIPDINYELSYLFIDTSVPSSSERIGMLWLLFGRESAPDRAA